MTLRAALPRLLRRDRPPPAIAVEDAPGRFVAVEVASDPRLLPAGAAARSHRTFWASWEASTLAPPGAVRLPGDVWERLRVHDRLYYRAHSSSSATGWRDHASTLPDARTQEAPFASLCDAWLLQAEAASGGDVDDLLARAAAHPSFAELERGGPLQALLLLHRFAARRPATPQALEWVVILQARPYGSETRSLIQRMRYDDREVVAWYERNASPYEPGDGTALVAEARAWTERPVGPFVVYQDPAPTPGDEGGTCVTRPPSGRCLYFARTRWAGAPEVIVPP